LTIVIELDCIVYSVDPDWHCDILIPMLIVIVVVVAVVF